MPVTEPAPDEDVQLPSRLEAFISKFVEWCDRDLDARTPKSFTGTLYHYTNAQGLIGIIERSELWFTRHANLNDPSEFQFGLGVLKASLTEAIGAAKSASPLAGTLCEMALDLCTPENFERSFGFYVVSLSSSGDNLEQWRLYGDDGRGFALGIQEKLFAPTDRPAIGPNFVMLPVVYGGQDGASLFRPWINEAIEVIARASDDVPDPRTAIKFVREIATTMLAGLVPFCLAVKHPAYTHEREVRLVLFGVKDVSEPDIRFRARGGEIVPFVPVNLATLRDHLVTIHIGPSANATTHGAIRILLNEYNVPAEIVRSELPYRS